MMLKVFTLALSDPNDPLTVCFQRISDNSKVVQSLTAKVKEIEDKLATKDLEIVELRLDLAKQTENWEKVCEKVDKIEAANYDERMDEMDQYGRRNTIRISGIPEDVEDTTEAAIELFKSKLGVEVKRSEIDRSHRVGKKIENKENKDKENKPEGATGGETEAKEPIETDGVVEGETDKPEPGKTSSTKKQRPRAVVVKFMTRSMQ